METTTIIITDVTRMKAPRVCIAGVMEDGQSIRPVFPYGNIEEDWLYENGRAIIRPFAKINLNLIEPRNNPPHCEDWVIQPESRRFLGLLNEQDKKALLAKITDPSVEKIFGAEMQTTPGHFIREREGCRSLGTVHARIVTRVILGKYDGKLDYRIEFVDESGCIYELAVTDLGFRYFVEHSLRPELGLARLASNLVQQFHQGEVYLRIGLARPTWKEHPHCCFLQVNSIYTFPDYLNGCCFADYNHKAALEKTELNP
jgi:hypothetical protein